MSSSAELALTAEGGVPVAKLEGDVDMANARDLRESLLAAVTNHAPGLVIDLSTTTYLDSAGIHLVFDLARRLGARQQQLRLVVPPESPIRRVLTLTSVSTVAPMHEQCDEAVAEMGSPTEGPEGDGDRAG